MKNTIAVYLEENPMFATFMGLIKFSALYQDLHGSQHITVMALPNEVFMDTTDFQLSRLINESRETIRSFIENHIIENKYKLNSLIHGARIETLNGNYVIIHNQDGILKINNSIVVRPDIRLSNGVIHVMDSMVTREILDGKRAFYSNTDDISAKSGDTQKNDNSCFIGRDL